jgi:death-on-curing protein
MDLIFFINKFIIEMENIAVTVADNIINKDLLFEIITSIINEEDYNEILKLKIINALEQVNPDRENIDLGTDFYRDLY